MPAHAHKLTQSPTGLSLAPTGAGRAGAPASVALSDLLAAFGSERAAQRWAGEQVRLGLAHKSARQWRVRPEARLPNGQAVAAYLKRRQAAMLAGFQLPPHHERWSERDRQRFLDSHELLRLFADCRREADDNATAAMRLAHHQGAWAHERGLRISLRSLYRLQRRLDPNSPDDFDGNVDRRGRAKKPASPCSPEAWQLFRSLYLQDNGLKLTKCYRFVQGEGQQHGWSWPSEPTIRRRVREELHPATLTLARRGPRRFEADCVPKCERDIEDILAGEWWCLDGRTLDSFARVPHARREWCEKRLVVTGVLDLRSRSLRLDLRATECSDGILVGIKQALRDWGAPTHVIADNGEAYKAAVGSPRGSLWQKQALADPRIGSVFGKLGVTLHTSIPYHGWAKPIESIWNKLKEDFDRWFWSFCGGSPAERPEGRDREIKRRIDDLPTIDEMRGYLRTWLDEYHATEQRGKGTRGLCPNLVFDQYRGVVRRVDLALVEQLSRRTVGPVKRTRDGFRWEHFLYGKWDEEVWRLKGDRYYLTIDPERADRVTVCEADGTPVCFAHKRELGGASQEDRREAARLQARYRRVHKEAAAARDYLRETPTAQVLAANRRHAQHRETDQRKHLPAPEPPAVTLVRPDLTAAVQKLEKQEQETAVRRAVEPVSKPRQSGFDKLAALAEHEDDQREERRDSCAWERLNYETEAAG